MQSYLDSVYLFLFPLPLVGHYLLVTGSGKYEMSISIIKIEHRTNSNDKINTKVLHAIQPVVQRPDTKGGDQCEN